MTLKDVSLQVEQRQNITADGAKSFASFVDLFQVRFHLSFLFE